METTELLLITCAVTGKAVETTANRDGSPKLPRGWKRVGEQLLSPQGVAASYVPRTLRLPVASVLLEGSDDPKIGWAELKRALRQSLQQTAQFANWCFLELAKLDTEPLVPTEKGVALPKIEKDTRNAWLRAVYQQGRARWPELDSQSLASVRNRVWSRYLQARWDLRITSKENRTSYRTGLPVPLPAQAVKFRVDQGNGWIHLRCRLGGAAFRLRLSGSSKYRYHAVGIKAGIEAGTVGEISLTERWVFGDNTERATVPANLGGRKCRSQRQVMAHVVVRLPRRKATARSDKVLVVKAQPDRLLSAFLEDREVLWDLNGDEIKRGISAHRDRLYRLAQDTKFERRRPKKEGQGLQARRERLLTNYHRWEQDWLHKVSRQVVGLAQRNECGAIRVDGTARWPVPTPWFKLLALIETKAAEVGITLEKTGFSEESEG